MALRLMRVAGGNSLSGLNPFGMFNRFLYQPNEIYMESGVIDVLATYARDPNAYKPANLKTLPSIAPISGTVFVIGKTTDASPTVCPTYSTEVKYETLTASTVKESSALGCWNKSAYVTMSDPRGDHLVCTYTLHPAWPGSLTGFIPGISIGSALQAGDTIMKDNETLAKSKADMVSKSCTLVEGFVETFPDPIPTDPNAPKLYCDAGLYSKKMCQLQKPPSLYTGKLKMFVQALYGSTTSIYNLVGNFSSYPPSYTLLLGTEQEEQDWKDKEMTARSPIRLDSDSHTLVSDHKYNYYIFQAGGAFNLLRPSSSGRALQKYLRASGSTLSKEKLRCLEATLLSTCRHTIWEGITDKSAFSDSMSHGGPLYHNWKTNWSGKEWARVVFERTSNDCCSTRLQKIKVDIDTSGLDTAASEEMTRKIEAARKGALQDLFEKERDANAKLPTGVNGEYIGPAPIYTEQFPMNTIKKVFSPVSGYLQKRIVTPYNPGNPSIGIPPTEEVSIYCPIGDWEDGTWAYSFVAPYDRPGMVKPAVDEAVKLEAERLQKRYGDLGLSMEYFTALKDLFPCTLDESDPKEINTKWQQDRMFTFDEEYNLYGWYDTSDGDKHTPKKNVQGIAPVYCWYSPSDKLVLVEYYCIDNAPWQNESFDSGVPCGSGGFNSMSRAWSVGSPFSGFVVNGNKVAAGTSGGFTENETSGTIGPGVPEEPYLSLNMQPFGCEDTVDNTNFSGIRGWNRNWFRPWWGYGEVNSKGRAGGRGLQTYLVIPRLDCEGVYTGNLSEKSGTQTASRSTMTALVAQELWACTNSGWQYMPISIGDPDVHTPTYVTCGGLYIGVEIGSNPIRLFGVQPGNLGNFPMRVRKPAGGDFMIYMGGVQAGDKQTGGCLADPWEIITWQNTGSTSKTNGFSDSECNGYFFNKEGKSFVLYQKQDSAIDAPSSVYAGLFTDLTKWLDPWWTYADSFQNKTSIQSSQGLVIVHNHVSKILTFPEELGIPKTYKCFVGAV